MISEIRMATVAVSDLLRARAFYENTFDYVCHAEARVTGDAFESLWNMPAGLEGQCAVVGPEGAATGLLRLVQFDQPGQQIWGDYSTPQNRGHYALNIRVPAIQEAMDRLQNNGGRSKSAPNYWTVSPEISAWDSLSYDPDGTIVDVFELEVAKGSLLDDYDGRCSALQTVAMHVADARQSARFYAALGFRPMYDKLIEGMEEFFKLPKGTALHNINLVMPGGANIGRIEIAQYVGWCGESLRGVAVPPNLGILSLSMHTDDLQATENLLQSIGAEPCSNAVEVNMPVLGAVIARTYYGPDGEVLEFFQPTTT
jgi:catechol 2,3-dioxygenase-like lactoylglutathione lyase family enzyme